MYKLDKADRKILYELDTNARIPLSKLAKKLKLSRDVVNYRINKLEKDKVIRGYNTFIDASRLGYKIFRVYFKFYSISNENFKKLVDLVSKNKKVFWVGQTDGFIDLVFGTWHKTSKEFNEFYKSIIEKFRPFIKQEYVHELIYYSYLDRPYIINQKPSQRNILSIGSNKEEKHDDIDLEILKILCNNARTQIIEIASQLEMDSASIIYRIKQLEKKKIIIGYKSDLNFHIINRSFYSVKLYLSNFGRKNELLSYLKTKNFVTNFTESIGSWDVEFDVEVENDEQYHDLINEIKDRFNFISEVSFFRVPKNIKVINSPL